jgi:predicted amidohydrolase
MSFLTITIIQPDLAWEDKDANLTLLSEKIKSLQEKTEIIILPEMFSTGFSMHTKSLAEKMDGETVQWMKNISSSKNVIVTGSIIIEEDGKYFNRLIWMLPDGNYGYYDKRHLFAFANEDQYYTAGKKRLIASVKGWKINLEICYDLRFPVWTRQTAHVIKNAEEINLEYDALIFVANWPQKRNHAWKTLLQARAIENQCYVIGANRVGKDKNEIYYSGDSMIIDPLGEVLYHKENEEDVFTYTLEKQKLTEVRQRFPFWRDADDFKL